MKQVTELAQRVAELERRVSHMHRHGAVHQVDAAKGLMRLRLGGSDQEPLLGPWIPYAQIAGALKVHAPPSVGQQFTMISPAGDYRQAVAVPMTWSDQNAAPSQKGDENVITYGGWRLKLDGTDLHVMKGSLSLLLQGDKVALNVADVAIAGNVHIRGDLRVDGTHFDHNAVFVGDHHVHTQVEPGGGLSGPPPGG